MKFALAFFIYFVTVYQPAIAVAGATDDVRPAQDDNTTEQSETVSPDSAAKVIIDTSRGQMLYENHCTSCHESMVYIRSKRKVKTYKELGNWVSQRADWLNLGWSDEEKQVVRQYLNEVYYKYSMTE